MLNINHLCIVLVEPQGPLNIGSVCRTMMNFGFTNLRLVSPCDDYKGEDARKMALKAEIIVNQAQVFSTLKEALADCHYVIGTSRRFGKYRNNFFLPDEGAKQVLSIADNCRAALVFGREDCGLKTEELDLCQAFITIPTNENFPSMNLAQAVTVCLYELNKALAHNGDIMSQRSLSLSSGEELETMFQHMKKTLLEIKYSDKLSSEQMLRTFRRIFGRALLTKRDTRVLHGLWSHIDKLKIGHKD